MPESPRPRVLFILPQPFFAHRGSALRARSTLNNLSKLGYQVDLLAYPLGEDISLPNVRILRGYPPPFIRHVKVGPSFKKVILDFFLLLRACSLPFKVKYAAFHGVEEAAVITALFGRMLGVPHFVDMHSSMEEQISSQNFFGKSLLAWIAAKSFAWATRSSAGVLTVCDEHTNELRSQHKIKAYTALDLPIDNYRFVDPSVVDALRTEFNLSGHNIILYAGNYAAYQGVELLVRGFAKLQHLNTSNSKPLKLVILGGGKEEESIRDRMKNLAKELCPEDSVLFIPVRPSPEVGNFLALADVLVSPRLSGSNTPLKIYSYLIAKKPIVATRISSHTQILSDESAYLCDVDPDSLAEAMNAALDNSEEGRHTREQKLQKAANLVHPEKAYHAFYVAVSNLYSPIAERTAKPNLPKTEVADQAAAR